MDQLKDTLENMRKRMGLEMFDDLDEFENLVSEFPDFDEEEDFHFIVKSTLFRFAGEIERTLCISIV